jgi:hypothetical protein
MTTLSMAFRFALAGMAGLALVSSPLGAQAMGRIEGSITDSVRFVLLPNASVLAVRVEPEPSVSAGATTDSRGRYQIDSLVPGRYMVEFDSQTLDSLEIILPPREVTVLAGRATRVDFALPSGRTLRMAACPGLTLPKETGAVVGRLLDADTEQPLAGAKVVVAWQDISVDRMTLVPNVVERTGAVASDSLGRYRLCGVPTASWLVLQVQADGRTGSAIRLQVPDSAGVVLRHLSLSTSSARSITDSSGEAVADTAAPPPLTGTAQLSGVVRGVGGLPLFDAQVRVVGARGTALSDARGGFELRDLPAGTQVLEVRHVGYLLAQQPVELRATRPVSQDVRLQRIVTLDSLRVLAQRSRYPEFERHRRMNAFGIFLTEDEVARQASMETSDLFRGLPGFTVAAEGLYAKVFSSRGVASLSGLCAPNVVIDGVPDQDINLMRPSNIGAMEIYRVGQPAPAQYDRGCGAIVIWAK